MSRLNPALDFSGESAVLIWIVAAICFATFTGAANSAEIIDLSVTPGTNSTEVVFLLDEPAGYRLERNRVWNRQDGDEILLAIDASASERQLEALGGLVTHLQILEGGSDPTAVRIGLSEPGLLVRDSVLVNPPRLVLNVSRSGSGAVGNSRGYPAAPAPTTKPASSRAGSVREIRVGSHPTFSRLVFELDAPATYRLEKEGSSELLVTLAAASDARNIRSDSKFIDWVRVEKGDVMTVARVRLNRADLRIKELTLSNPHRIVIDVTEGR